jgi:hypothetical protein
MRKVEMSTKGLVGIVFILMMMMIECDINDTNNVYVLFSFSIPILTSFNNKNWQ